MEDVSAWVAFAAICLICWFASSLSFWLGAKFGDNQASKRYEDAIRQLVESFRNVTAHDAEQREQDRTDAECYRKWKKAFGDGLINDLSR